MKKLAMKAVGILLLATSVQAGLLNGEGFEGGHTGISSDINFTAAFNTPASVNNGVDGKWNTRSALYASTTNTGWTGQTESLAFEISNNEASTALIGTFQIIDVTSLGDISGQKLSLNYDMTRSSADVGGALNARYHVIGFNVADKSTVLVDVYGLGAGFSGTGFDWIAQDEAISAGDMGITNFNPFGVNNVTLTSDYDYLGVFLAASDTGDGGWVAIDNVQLTLDYGSVSVIHVDNLLDDPSFTSNPDGSPEVGADIWSWKSGTKLMNFQSAGEVASTNSNFTAPINIMNNNDVTGHGLYHPDTTKLASITPSFIGANVRYAGAFADVTNSGTYNAWYEITITNGATVYTATSDAVNLFVGDSGDAAARQVALDTEILNWNTITWDTDPFAGGGIVYSDIAGIGIQWFEETTSALTITNTTAYFLFEEAPIKYSVTMPPAPIGDVLVTHLLDDPAFTSNPDAGSLGTVAVGHTWWYNVDKVQFQTGNGGPVGVTNTFTAPITLTNHTDVVDDPDYDPSTTTLVSIEPNFQASYFNRINDTSDSGDIRMWYVVTVEAVGGTYKATSGYANPFISNDDAVSGAHVAEQWNSLTWDMFPYASGIFYEDIIDVSIEWFHTTATQISPVAIPAIYFQFLESQINYTVSYNQIKPSGFAVYMDSYGLSGGNAAADFDYDSDGWDNLMEYALGSDPTGGVFTGELPVLNHEGGTLGYIYAQRSNDDTLTYYLELSSSLVFTNWANTGYTVTGTNVTGSTFDYVTNSIATDAAAEFVRLVVEQN